VNTAIVSDGGGYSGIGFAVPSDIVRRVVPQLIETGKVRQAGLGVQLLPDRLSRQASVEGVAIWKVQPGGAAQKRACVGWNVRAGDPSSLAT